MQQLDPCGVMLRWRFHSLIENPWMIPWMIIQYCKSIQTCATQMWNWERLLWTTPRGSCCAYPLPHFGWRMFEWIRNTAGVNEWMLAPNAWFRGIKPKLFVESRIKARALLVLFIH